MFQLSGTAFAQEDICAGIFTHDEWTRAMDAADEAFAAFKVDDAKKILVETRKSVPCLDRIVLPSYLGRYARQQALVAFYEQDEITAVRWGMLQRYAAPNMAWPADFSEDHPLREILDFADEPALSGPENAGLSFPKKGAVFMNGRLLTEPKARAEVPNLIQVADKSGLILSQFWQDGAAFSDETLGEVGSVPELPKWFVAEDDAVASVSKPDKQPKSGLKIINLAAGGGMAVLAGTLYAVGGASRGSLDKATTTPELAAARSRVNILAMTSGVAFAGAVGVGVTAFVDTNGGSLGLNWRF